MAMKADITCGMEMSIEAQRKSNRLRSWTVKALVLF
jgi:hypothetical protein